MSKSSPTTPPANMAESRQDEASRDIIVEENAEAKQGEDQPSLADLVRAEMATHGITEQDVADAIKWARSFEDDDE